MNRKLNHLAVLGTAIYRPSRRPRLRRSGIGRVNSHQLRRRSSTWVLIPLRLDPLQDPLEQARKLGAGLFHGARVEVDDPRLRSTWVRSRAMTKGFKTRPASVSVPTAWARSSGWTTNPWPKRVHPGKGEPQVGAQCGGRRQVRTDGQVRVDPALILLQRDVYAVRVPLRVLRHDARQRARGRACRPGGHGDAHGRPLGGIDPGMVRDREHQGQRSIRRQVPLDDLAVEGLLEAVGGDEPETAGTARSGSVRRPGATSTRRSPPIRARRARPRAVPRHSHPPGPGASRLFPINGGFPPQNPPRATPHGADRRNAPAGPGRCRRGRARR